MPYQTPQAYYGDSSQYGSYGYTSLTDLVTNFQLIKTGNHSLVNQVERYVILFHAKSIIKTLTFDAVRDVKTLELNIEDSLRFILPSDYVNWINVYLFRDGLVRPLTENIQPTSATQYSQTSNGTIVFDVDGNPVTIESEIDGDRLDGTLKSIYLNNNNPDDWRNGDWGWNLGGVWYFSTARYGLNTETANVNPTFRIANGVINFSSEMNGQSCILEYISDGMANGDDSQVFVNKMFEKYLYLELEYQILSSKLAVQEYVLGRLRKAATAELRNAKIRISNIHPSRLLMAMRGQDRIIK